MASREERWAKRCEALGFECRQTGGMLGLTLVDWVRDGDPLVVTLHGPPSQFSEGHLASAVVKLPTPLRCGLVARSDEPPQTDPLPPADAREPLDDEARDGLDELDGWTLAAIDRERAAALLRAVASELVVADGVHRGCHLKVDDDSVSLAFSALPKEKVLSRAIDALLLLGERVEAARNALPPAEWAQTAAATWREVAQEGDAIDEERLAFSGRRDGYRFEVTARLDPHDGRAHLNLTGEPDRRGLSPIKVMRASAGLGFGMVSKLLGFVTVKTGDRAFDARFATCGSSREAALVPMTPAVRQRLVALPPSVFQLDASDGHLQLASDDLLDAEALAEVLASLSVLLDELPERDEPKPQSSQAPDAKRVLMAVLVVVAIVVVLFLAGVGRP